MGLDAKDMVIRELEFELGLMRGRLAQSQCLNIVLEEHSYFLELKLGAQAQTISQLRSEVIESKLQTVVSENTLSMETENQTDDAQEVNKRSVNHEVATMNDVSLPFSELSTYKAETLIEETVTVEEEVVEHPQVDDNFQIPSDDEINEEAFSSSRCPRLLTEGILNSSRNHIDSPAVGTVQVIYSQRIRDAQAINSVEDASNLFEQVDFSSRAINNIETFKCDFNGCGKVFNRKNNLTVHRQRHFGEKKFRCRQKGCGKRFVIQNDRTRHERLHADRKFVCTIGQCSKKFALRTNLRQHHEKFHLEVLKFQCDHCDLPFLNVLDRDHHVHWKHRERALENCPDEPDE